MARKKRQKAAKQRGIRAQNLTQLSQRCESTGANYTPFQDNKEQTQDFEMAGLPANGSTLGDRFHALPAELRLHIFSFLICQPVKWNIRHKEDCDSEPPRLDGEAYGHWPKLKPAFDTCIRCCTGHWHTVLPLWKRHDPIRLTWRNPWRSRWAPEVTNEFMGSDCWDEHMRPRPCPQGVKSAVEKDALRCLCARRQNLEVMLVCKQWREEAGRLFYSGNVFAFEDATTFVSFVDSLPDQWRKLVTKLSVLSHRPVRPNHIMSEDAQVEHLLSYFGSSKAMSPLWSALRRLPALSYLELDALLLTRVHIVKCLLRLGLTNLRSIRFTLPRVSFWDPNSDKKPMQYVYPEYENPRFLVGGLAEEVAGATKGHRRAWLKQAGSVEAAVAREIDLQEPLLYGSATPRTGVQQPEAEWLVGEALHYDEDLEEWGRLWDRFGSAAKPVYAYLPTSGHRVEAVESQEEKGEDAEAEVPLVSDVDLTLFN
ncbi:hypothetical protein LTR09_010079 [Extremus antarcticus]|uniref:Uncharacterized protein n=1 Tax=Extremus antarcticus TaxID=702011 RepID=A0AAJ0D832_9PEZI|nr:hypothetical protein LTR09_010079 [Extremus antarcticus]